MLRRPYRRYAFNPWYEMERLHREMNRLFSDPYASTGGRTAPAYPAMNAWTNDEGAVITADLPGFSADDVEISIVDNTLTLSGSRAPDELAEGDRYHRRERSYGRFTRNFELPFKVEAKKVEAKFDKGVLHISLPRAEADKPRKITVKSA